MRTITFALGALLAAAVAGAADTESEGAEEQELETPIQGLPAAEQAQCAAFGETYLRIAEMRDTGADKSVAINRGVEYLGTLGTTGSHVRGNYKGAVANFAEFVYANPKLNNHALYIYGLGSCAISKLAPDDAGFEKAMTGFEKMLGRCQVKYPEREQVKDLGVCLLTPLNKQFEIWARRAAQQ